MKLKPLLAVLIVGLFMSCGNKDFSHSSTDTSELTAAKKTTAMEKPSKAKQNYKKYYNSKYDYLVKYPANFGKYTEGDDGSGMSAHANDGSMLISTYASYNVLFTEDDDIYTMMETYKGWHIDDGCTITYQFAKGKSIVLSGYTKGGLIFYEKTVLYTRGNDEYIATVYYEYPKSEKAAGNAAIALIGNFPNE